MVFDLQRPFPNPRFPAVIPLRLGANNLYLVPGPAGFVCIDAGPDYAGAWEALMAQLAAHGIAPGDVRAVVLTHAHRDHAGLAARWQETGARVYAGRGDEDELTLDERGREEPWTRAAAALVRHGVPPELARSPVPRRAIARSEDGGGDWPGPLRMTALRPDRLLGDDEAVTDAGVSLRVLAHPGHTPGTLLIFDQDHGAIFTGDHVLPGTVATTGIQFAHGQRRPSMVDFARSLARTVMLARPSTDAAPLPADPGHGERIDDLAAAAEWSIRHLTRRAERLRRRLAEGPATAYDLARRQLPHLRPDHLWPVMAETIGLLDLLQDRGEAVTEPSEGYLVYHAVG